MNSHTSVWYTEKKGAAGRRVHWPPLKVLRVRGAPRVETAFINWNIESKTETSSYGISDCFIRDVL